MDRLSFLKTLGVGIAAAVITPKVLLDAPKKEIDLEKPPYYDDLVSKYGHFEEEYPRRLTVEQLCLNDLCLDREGRPWMCTGLIFGDIELTALSAEPQPNFIEVKRDSFDEYFFIFANAFSERS